MFIKINILYLGYLLTRMSKLSTLFICVVGKEQNVTLRLFAIENKIILSYEKKKIFLIYITIENPQNIINQIYSLFCNF